MLRHHVCRECGQYRGRVVLDVVRKAEKKEEKRKTRAKELEAQGQSSRQSFEEPKDDKKPHTPEEEKILSPEEILRK